MLQVRRQVYLDNNATTSVSPKVARAMWRVLRHCHGNPSSPYRVGRAAAAVLEESRQRVAATLGARPQEVLFTGSASEANNQVLLSCARLASAGRRTIVSTPIEHPSVLATLASLRGTGIDVHFCSVDAQGLVVFEALRALVDSSTLLVCVMLANNEIGTIQDVRAIADLAHRQGALMMSDCVQALGKMPVDVKALAVDFATFSAHKIYGPKGVGVLYADQGRGILPLIHGGHQEGGLRAGTESLHNIAGLATACDEGPRLLAGAGQVARLKGLLAEGIRTLLPTVLVNSPAEACLPTTLSVTLPGFDSAEAIAFLDYHGIAVSAGSACNTQSNEPSPVLKAIGLTDTQARQTLRFSLSTQTRARDIRYVLRVLRAYLQGGTLPVTMVRPDQVGADLLQSPGLFVLDIRSSYDRRLLKGLPNAHEVPSFIGLGRYLHAIPRDRNLLIVCQAGVNAPIAAYYLKAQGYRQVAFLMGGALGWRLFQPALYETLGGMNPLPLSPEVRRA